MRCLRTRLSNPGNRRESRLNTTQRYPAFFYLILTLGYTGVIYGLSSLPGDATQAGLSGIIAWTPPALQNLLHVPLFGLLAWLCHRTLVAWNMHYRPAFSAAFLLAVGFGIFDEWHQLHVPGRYASFTDIVLNCAGALLALWWVHRRKHRQARPESGSHPLG